MADKKLTELTQITSVTNNDLLYLVRPSGGGVFNSYKVTVGTLTGGAETGVFSDSVMVGFRPNAPADERVSKWQIGLRDKNFRLDHSTSGQPTIYFDRDDNNGATSYIRYNRSNNGVTWRFNKQSGGGEEFFGPTGGNFYLNPTDMVISGSVYIRDTNSSGLIVGSPTDPQAGDGNINCMNLYLRDRGFRLVGHASTPRIYFDTPDTESFAGTPYVGYNRGTDRIQIYPGSEYQWTEIMGGLHIFHASGGSGLKVGSPSDDFIGEGGIIAEKIACRDKAFRMEGHPNTPRLYFSASDSESSVGPGYIGYNRSTRRLQLDAGGSTRWAEILGGLHITHAEGGSGLKVGNPFGDFIGEGGVIAEKVASYDYGFRMEGSLSAPKIYFNINQYYSEDGFQYSDSPPNIQYQRQTKRFTINCGDPRYWAEVLGGLHIYHNSGGSGLMVGNPTGGWKGEGTINAQSIFDDGATVTCYAIEKAVTGEIDLEYWDSVAGGEHKAARRFVERNMDLDPRSYAGFWKSNRHLPALPSKEEWSEEQLSLGDLVQRLIETVEVQAVHIDKLQQQIDALRDTVKGLLNGTDKGF